MRRAPQRHKQAGTSMLEVLITILILTVGLLGLAGLQTRLQLSEMEGYQRAQANILLDDMAHRIESNRSNAANYVTGTADPLGGSASCPSAVTTLQNRDAREWCLGLQGAAEKSGTSAVGAMIGGRGCVESLGNNQYMITVTWQGMGALAAPPDSVACGAGAYDSTTTGCSNDLCRRAVTTIVQIAPLI